MMHILRGIGDGQPAALLAEGHFFWCDIRAGDRTAEELAEALAIPEHALRPLLDFDPEHARSRKFHVDADHVVFLFGCLVDGEPIEVHVLVSGDYVLTVHAADVALPDILDAEVPEGRSEQYVIYAVLEAMLGTHFDELSAVNDELDDLLERSITMQNARLRNQTLRVMMSRLTRLRHQAAPLRGTYARVSHEIRRVRGLEPDSEEYFERVGRQVDHLVEAIDAAADGLARMIDLRLNETTYWLTAVATVFLPLTFVTGFFGMNFAWMVRHIDSAFAFFLLGVGGCALGALTTVLAVRRRAPLEDEGATRRARL